MNISEERPSKSEYTLSNGVSLKTSTRNNTGYRNAFWINGDDVFKAQVPRLIVSGDSRYDKIQPNNVRGFNLGIFDDALQAAYYSQYFIDNFEEMSDKYFKYLRDVNKDNGGNVTQINRVVKIDYPSDLYDLPNPTPEECGSREISRNSNSNPDISNQDRLSQISRSQDNISAEDTFIKFLSKPEFKQAWDSTGEEKIDSREDVISKIKNNISYEQALAYLKGYLNESRKRKTLGESKQTINRIKMLAGLK
jgi:hypothetical protein